MNKSILVIKTPKHCYECPLNNNHFCSATDNCVLKYSNCKPNWCPLKDAPRMKFTYIGHDDEATANYNRGWNDCLKKIKSE